MKGVLNVNKVNTINVILSFANEMIEAMDKVNVKASSIQERLQQITYVSSTRACDFKAYSCLPSINSFVFSVCSPIPFS